MPAKPNLKEMFQEWNELNIKAQESMGQFDFSNIKIIRKEQKEIEDNIYEILKDNAPENIKAILPDDCGEMEVGYDTEGHAFYFVMIDEDDSTDEEVKLNAITIDTDSNISLIEDFEME